MDTMRFRWSTGLRELGGRRKGNSLNLVALGHFEGNPGDFKGFQWIFESFGAF